MVGVVSCRNLRSRSLINCFSIVKTRGSQTTTPKVAMQKARRPERLQPQGRSSSVPFNRSSHISPCFCQTATPICHKLGGVVFDGRTSIKLFPGFPAHTTLSHPQSPALPPQPADTTPGTPASSVQRHAPADTVTSKSQWSMSQGEQMVCCLKPRVALVHWTDLLGSQRGPMRISSLMLMTFSVVTSTVILPL